MCKTKYFQVAFPTYLVFVHMVLVSQMSVECVFGDHPLVDTNSPAIPVYFHLYNMQSKMHVEIKGKIPHAISPDKTNHTKLEVKSYLVRRSKEDGGGQVALTLMGKQSGRFLCFNKKGKLITRFDGNHTTCLFEEILTTDGHYEFHLIDNPTWKLGFNQRGKPLAAPWQPLRHTGSSTKFMEREKESPVYRPVPSSGPVESSDALANSIRRKEMEGSREKRFTSSRERAQTLRRRRATSDSSASSLTSGQTLHAVPVPTILRLLKLLK